MSQTQSLQEHLAAVRDELKSAAQKTDPDARARIDAAMQHVQMAVSQLQSGSSGDETMRRLDELAKNCKKAMEESGDALHARIETMMAQVKNAAEAAKQTK